MREGDIASGVIECIVGYCAYQNQECILIDNGVYSYIGKLSYSQKHACAYSGEGTAIECIDYSSVCYDLNLATCQYLSDTYLPDAGSVIGGGTLPYYCVAES